MPRYFRIPLGVHLQDYANCPLRTILMLLNSLSVRDARCRHSTVSSHRHTVILKREHPRNHWSRVVTSHSPRLAVILLSNPSRPRTLRIRKRIVSSCNCCDTHKAKTDKQSWVSKRRRRTQTKNQRNKQTRGGDILWGIRVDAP